MGYKIAKYAKVRNTIGSEMDPVCGETDISVETVVLRFPYQKEYGSFIAAAVALDNLKTKGEFTIIKINK